MSSKRTASVLVDAGNVFISADYVHVGGRWQRIERRLPGLHFCANQTYNLMSGFTNCILLGNRCKDIVKLVCGTGIRKSFYSPNMFSGLLVSELRLAKYGRRSKDVEIVYRREYTSEY